MSGQYYLQDNYMVTKQTKTIKGTRQIDNNNIDVLFNMVENTAPGKIHDSAYQVLIQPYCQGCDSLSRKVYTQRIL